MNSYSSKPLIFLFSGQGSHYYHMGHEVFSHNQIFQTWMYAAEKIFQAKTGLSLLDNLYSKQVTKSMRFDRTLMTHAAIFMVQYALAQTLMSEGIRPDYVLGTSLGEFVAMTIAGCLDFETALNSVILHAQLIEKYCKSASMIAVLHDPQLFLQQPLVHQLSELAGINFNQHFVITCDSHHLKQIEIFLKENEIIYQVLAVSHGFHSSLTDQIAKDFLAATSQLSITPAKIPFISCAEATIFNNIDHSHLLHATRKPILFQQTIQQLEEINNYVYIDVGPSGTLATFTKYNLAPTSNSIVLSCLTPFGNDVDNLERLKAKLS